MTPSPRRWIGALLLPLLPLATSAWSAEPPSSATAAPAAEVDTTDSAAGPAPATPSFELRSAGVRDIVRNTASMQGSFEYRLETARKTPSDADIAAALREARREVTRPPSQPRLPERPPPCDGFWSCGLETLLGLEDFDDETYGQVARHRLMNQGAFNDSSKINASVPLPLSPAEVQQAGAPHKP